MAACFICTKHEDMSVVPGGEVVSDEHCIVSHLALVTPNRVERSVYLGYLFVEPRRHVAELGELTDPEASSLGRLAALASAGLQRATGAEHVYAAVIGHGVEHLHLHLIARYPQTPREFWWTRVDEWPDAPRGGASAVNELASRIRAALPRLSNPSPPRLQNRGG
jgi:histidine triad (HIT) family protein